MNSSQDKRICLIGYGGHALVACDIFTECGQSIYSYCDRVEKEFNPYNLAYWGDEQSLDPTHAKDTLFFPAIGSNTLRKDIFERITGIGGIFTNAIHPRAVVSRTADIGMATMVAAGAVVNPWAKIGNGVICNTSCAIDHEAVIEDFAHIGPGSVLCGNVFVGESSFVGAGTVVKPGVRIGRNVVIGAGAVVVKDVPDGMTVFGVPARPKP